MNRVSLILILGLMILGFVSGASEYVEGEIIVKYKDPSINLMSSKLFGTESIENTYDKNIKILKFRNNENIIKKAKELSKLNYIEYAEPNYILHIHQKPNDINYSVQWGLPKINVEEAWNLTTGNNSIIIAIIDTGIEWDHPDLQEKIWNNTDEDCNISTDKDNNGYFGDCRGYDFVNIQNESECSSITEDCNDTDNNPYDQQGHGTHCAGIAGASTDNNLGIAGICPNCKIMPLRAGYKDTQNKGILTLAAVVDSINYAVNNGATIISMSFGGANNMASMEDALNNAYNQGVILVSSAGNENVDSFSYPAAYQNVISIGSSNPSDSKSSFSNYGNWVNLAAPGTNIYSTYLSHGYTYLDGTSMATPLVAGTIGLIKSLFPSKNQTEILSSLNNTGETIDFISNNITRINVYNVLLSLDNVAPNVTLVSPSNEHVNLSTNQSFVCNATDWQLANVTFKIWNSTGFYYNETKNLTGTENETVFDLTNMPEESYTWNCFAVDGENNLGTAPANFSLTVGGVEVNLNSPENNSATNVNETFFNCSSFSDADYELVNVSFSLWNSTGTLIKNETKNISGFENVTIFNYTFTMEDNYAWQCVAINNNSDMGNGDNFTVTYDVSIPTISDLTAENVGSSSATITWTTDEETNSSVGGDVGGSNSEYTTSHSVVISELSALTLYSYNVTSCDRAGNCDNDTGSFTTTSAPSSGGGGGISAKTYVVEDKEFRLGKTEELKAKDKMIFSLASGRHELRALEVQSSSVDIMIESNPIYLTLVIGGETKLNMSSPLYYDLMIRLNSIRSRKANITITRILEEIEKEIVENETEEIVEKETEDGDKIYHITEDEKTDYKPFIFGIVIALVVFIGILLKIKSKKLKASKTSSKHGKKAKAKAVGKG